MANLGAMFDANTIAPESGRGPIPTADYRLMIVDSKETVSKNSGNKMIELTFEVIEGNFKGSKVWHYLNLWHPSQQTAQIAQAQLSSICHATGRLQVTDTQQLHNIPMVCRVEHEAADPAKNKREGNKIASWRSASAAPAGGAPGPGMNAPGAQAPGVNTPSAPAAPPPWGGTVPAPAPAPAATAAPWNRQAA